MTQKPRPVIPVLALVAGVALAGVQWLIYVYAPEERSMGIIQKVFYLHMPFAWWAMLAFFTAFAAGALYLIRRRLFWDNIALAATETGVLFATLALFTGSLWARRAWGAWWTWDPRLTTTLVMWFAYAVCILLRNSIPSRERRAVVCSVLAIVAFLDVPLVFYSARIWRGIHPGSLVQSNGLEPEMKTAMWSCVAAVGLLWFALTAVRARQANQKDFLEKAALERLECETRIS